MHSAGTPDRKNPTGSKKRRPGNKPQVDGPEFSKKTKFFLQYGSLSILKKGGLQKGKKTSGEKKNCSTDGIRGRSKRFGAMKGGKGGKKT